MNGVYGHKILDLSEVTLVDIAAVQFLLGCQNEGIELARCPPYVREWLVRERVEEARLEGCQRQLTDLSGLSPPKRAR